MCSRKRQAFYLWARFLPNSGMYSTNFPLSSASSSLLFLINNFLHIKTCNNNSSLKTEHLSKSYDPSSYCPLSVITRAKLRLRSLHPLLPHPFFIAFGDSIPVYLLLCYFKKLIFTKDNPAFHIFQLSDFFLTFNVGNHLLLLETFSSLGFQDSILLALPT